MNNLIQRVLEYNKKQAQKDEKISELKEALNIMGGEFGNVEKQLVTF